MKGRRMKGLFRRICEEGNTIWFVTDMSIVPFLCQYDLEKEKMISLIGFWEKIGCNGPYEVIAKFDKRLILVPYYSDYDILEYDLIENKYRTIAFPSRKERIYTKVIEYDNSFFFMGVLQTDIIIEYQIKQKSYIFHDNVLEEVRKKCGENFLWSGYVQIDNLLYLPVFQTNKIVVMQMPEVKIFKWLELPFKYSIMGIGYLNKNFWIIPTSGNVIVKVDFEKNNFEQIILPIPDDMERPFAVIEPENEKIVLKPENADNGYEIKIIDNQITRINKDKESNLLQIEISDNRSAVKSIEGIQNKYYLDLKRGVLYHGDKCYVIKISLKSEKGIKLIEEYFEKKIIAESEKFLLSDYINVNCGQVESSADTVEHFFMQNENVL